MTFKVYIPARFAARRLPGKPLLELDGKPLVQHVYERACESGAEEVVVATDDERIKCVAERFGASVCMTSEKHLSGTDRIAEAVRFRKEPPESVIVNVQADEPMMPSSVICQVASLAEDSKCDVASVCEPLDGGQVFDPNVVKVVRDCQDYALYFSRAPIPWSRDDFDRSTETPAFLDRYRRHVGIYGYRAAFLQQFVCYTPAPIEELECLEQLRALYFGAKLAVADAIESCGNGVDTQVDLDRLRRR